MQVTLESVSILVLVDLAHEYTIGCFWIGVYYVSILVLVDLAHEFDIGFDNNLAFFGCFNPCFSGSCSRMGNQGPGNPRTCVSILVLVDLAHEFNLTRSNILGTDSFQSLF